MPPDTQTLVALVTVFCLAIRRAHLQAIVCQQSYNSSAGCKSKSYCVWEFDNFDGREVCVHRDTVSRGTDAYSKEYAAVKVGYMPHGFCQSGVLGVPQRRAALPPG